MVYMYNILNNIIEGMEHNIGTLEFFFLERLSLHHRDNIPPNNYVYRKVILLDILANELVVPLHILVCM